MDTKPTYYARHRETIQARQRIYIQNRTLEQRVHKQQRELRYLKNQTPEQTEQRKAYQRDKMRQKRLDPVYMAQFYQYATAWRSAAKECCINMYSNGEACCALCPQADIDVLCLDHIDEGATQLFTKQFGHRGGQFLYARLRTLGYPPGFQVLCSNCNLKKEMLRRRHKIGHRHNGY